MAELRFKTREQVVTLLRLMGYQEKIINGYHTMMVKDKFISRRTHERFIVKVFARTTVIRVGTKDRERGATTAHEVFRGNHDEALAYLKGKTDETKRQAG